MLPSAEGGIEEVGRICRLHGVERLDLFGPAARGTFDEGGSDLDFVVSFDRREPPELFGRSVDLVTEAAVETNAHFARSVASTRVLLYRA